MNPRMRCSLLVFILVVAFFGWTTDQCIGLRVNPLRSFYKGGIEGNSRKLLGIEVVLDYDYAGPNPKHDPRGKRGGGGSKSP